jgi:hypothetical protein
MIPATTAAPPERPEQEPPVLLLLLAPLPPSPPPPQQPHHLDVRAPGDDHPERDAQGDPRRERRVRGVFESSGGRSSLEPPQAERGRGAPRRPRARGAGDRRAHLPLLRVRSVGSELVRAEGGVGDGPGGDEPRGPGEKRREARGVHARGREPAGEGGARDDARDLIRERVQPQHRDVPREEVRVVHRGGELGRRARRGRDDPAHGPGAPPTTSGTDDDARGGGAGAGPRGASAGGGGDARGRRDRAGVEARRGAGEAREAARPEERHGECARGGALLFLGAIFQSLGINGDNYTHLSPNWGYLSPFIPKYPQLTPRH